MPFEERLAACLAHLAQLDEEWSKSAHLPASQAQLQLLLWIGQHPGCRLQHIAAGLNLTAPTVSVGVRRLEQMGFIERASDGHDQRAISLMVSAAGLEVYNLATQARQLQVREMLERLRPAEQRHLLILLEKVLGIQHSPTEKEPPLETPEPQLQQPAPPSDESEESESPTQLTFFGA